MFDKIALRQQIQTQRKALSATEIQAYAKAFLTKIHCFFKDHAPQKIAVYLATQGELDLTPSIHWLWQQGYSLYLPILQEKNLLFGAYQSNTSLTQNRYGILEPIGQNFFPPQELDAVLVPLVAFDAQGHRLGMGQGYYDRTFAFRKTQPLPLLIGCGYAFQQVDALEVEDHDISLDLILSV